MKAIMISIKPKYMAKILNGEKTIEIRKIMPKCKLPIDVYIYCTKEKSIAKLCKYPCDNDIKAFIHLGKVVAKFTLNNVEKFEWDSCSRDNDGYWLDYGERFNIKPTCLAYEELFAYIKGDVGYAWHISNLEIFDKPKELSDFYKANEQMEYIESLWNGGGLPDKDDYDDVILTKAPQSWCYVEVLL